MVTMTVAEPWRLCRDGGCCRGGLGSGDDMVDVVVMVSAGVAAMVGMVSAGVDGGDDVGGSE
ncbi:hypothetical protein Tco_0216858, partial [Tanacetum coccineum]